MTNLPFVSVVIPTDNGARYIAEGLRSVFTQEFRLEEVIVVEDAMTANYVSSKSRTEDHRHASK